MTFEIPDSKKSIGQNVFEVKAGTKTFKLPKAEYMSSRQALVFESGDLKAMFDLLDDLSTPKGLGEVLLDAPVSAMEELMQAWTGDSGLSVGESSASED